ncbi:hypothetical protein [Spirosoma rhododendri]|uniref:Uncharacterized protein n=1 Tax=Spirosoma rhododendri TaxID=2728024 RepID=A0A7L5DG41_9BACT|nr:hypothetical protein [Spirosoma rhododendri]QJD77079.1 hypothetical protein HH216_00595 [Spirosoma rhododendri]
MTTLAKRKTTVVLIVALLLLLPLVAMQFTNEVNWTLSDFVVAGLLLLASGLSFEFALRKVRTSTYRIAACTAILAVLVLVWLELAVGIFGTPFAGQ